MNENTIKSVEESETKQATTTTKNGKIDVHKPNESENIERESRR